MSPENYSQTFLEIRILQKIGPPGRIDFLYRYFDGHEHLVSSHKVPRKKGEFKEIARAVADSLDAGITNGIIDLAELVWLNSSGATLLVDLWKEFYSGGGQLVFVNPKPRVAEVFRITKLDQAFTIVDSLEDAIEIFEFKGGGNSA